MDIFAYPLSCLQNALKVILKRKKLISLLHLFNFVKLPNKKMEERKAEKMLSEEWKERENFGVEELEEKGEKARKKGKEMNNSEARGWWEGVASQFFSSAIYKLENEPNVGENSLRERDELLMEKRERIIFKLGEISLSKKKCTSISSEIYELFFFEQVEEVVKLEQMVNEEGLLDWKFFEKESLIDGLVIVEEELMEVNWSEVKVGEYEWRMGRTRLDKEINYACKKLRFLCRPFGKYLKEIQLEVFESRYSFLKNPAFQLEEIYDIFRAFKKGESFYACLALSSIVERMIRNFIQLKSPRGSDLPKKLSELMENVGFAPYVSQSQLFLLKCLVGPFSGFNLRNILWHGFVSKEEVNEDLVSFLFLTFLSLSKVYVEHASPIISNKFSFEPLVDVSSYDPNYSQEKMDKIFEGKINCLKIFCANSKIFL